jgi:hypothetical protein
MMELFCIVCKGAIPERRIERAGVKTCSLKCGAEFARMLRETWREQMAGNTCPTCLRYVPLNSTEAALIESLRLPMAHGHANAARFV